MKPSRAQMVERLISWWIEELTQDTDNIVTLLESGHLFKGYFYMTDEEIEEEYVSKFDTDP